MKFHWTENQHATKGSEVGQLGLKDATILENYAQFCKVTLHAASYGQITLERARKYALALMEYIDSKQVLSDEGTWLLADIYNVWLDYYTPRFKPVDEAILYLTVTWTAKIHYKGIGLRTEKVMLERKYMYTMTVIDMQGRTLEYVPIEYALECLTEEEPLRLLTAR